MSPVSTGTPCVRSVRQYGYGHAEPPHAARSLRRRQRLSPACAPTLPLPGGGPPLPAEQKPSSAGRADLCRKGGMPFLRGPTGPGEKPRPMCRRGIPSAGAFSRNTLRPLPGEPTKPSSPPSWSGDKRFHAAMLHPVALLGALGVVEPVGRAHKVAGNAPYALKGHAPAHALLSVHAFPLFPAPPRGLSASLRNGKGLERKILRPSRLTTPAATRARRPKPSPPSLPEHPRGAASRSETEPGRDCSGPVRSSAHGVYDTWPRRFFCRRSF